MVDDHDPPTKRRRIAQESNESSTSFWKRFKKKALKNDFNEKNIVKDVIHIYLDHVEFKLFMDKDKLHQKEIAVLNSFQERVHYNVTCNRDIVPSGIEENALHQCRMCRQPFLRTLLLCELW